MDTDRNLLLGVLALLADLIDAAQFVEACTAWTARKDVSLVDVLIERGWLVEADKAHLEYLMERRLRKDGGDAKASLATVADDVQRSLVVLNDPEIQHSLGGGREDAANQETTIHSTPEFDERYERTHLHATGGIGRVWLAHDTVLGRDVALKELRPERAGDANLATRFLQEARITGQLEHPGIVPVYELVQPSGNREPFYTMRFVNGRTLDSAARDYHERRAEEPDEEFDFVTLLNAFVTVCNTVAYGHSRGIIHRDLKGQNVILGDFGEVVVLDWGLAKHVAAPDVDPHGPATLPNIGLANSRLTLDGEAVGTPAFMAPEQAAGRIDQIDHRTDVYGLGAMLYEILTGQPPFSGANTDEVLDKVQHEEPLPPRQLNDDVPELLEAACLKALAKDPAERFTSASELAQQVERWQEVQRRQAEQALRDSEALYRSLVDVLPLILVRKDLQGRFTFANGRACQSFGRPLEEILGKTDFDFFSAELAEESQRTDCEVAETGKTFEYPPFLYPDKGEDRYFQSIKTPVRDAQGKIIGVQVVIWDVSELKRAEKALSDSEALYRSLVDMLPLILVRKDLDHRFTFANKRFCASRGKPLEEIVGKTDFDFFPVELAEEYQRNDRRVLATGEILETEENYIENGEERDIRVIKTPLYDSRGELRGLQLICWDITDLKRAERALRDSEALYRSLVDMLPLVLIRKDLDGRFTFANKRFCELLGKPLEEIVGRTDFDLFPTELAEDYQQNDLQVLATRKSVETEEESVDDKGEKQNIQVIKTPIYDSRGELTGIQSIGWDVTERKRLEKALARTTTQLVETQHQLKELRDSETGTS